MPALRAISSSLFAKHTYQLDTVSPTRWSCLIRTLLNKCLVINVKVTKMLLCTRGYLMVLTISVITMGQLYVNS